MLKKKYVDTKRDMIYGKKLHADKLSMSCDAPYE